MLYKYNPMGVCSMEISFEMENDIVSNVKFFGGCAGNTKGVAKLCEGRDAHELVELLEGITCGGKGTSCPDQLARAIKKAINE